MVAYSPLEISLRRSAETRFRDARCTPRRTAGSFAATPGSMWLSLVDFLYSAKTVEKVFKPIVADWRKEYFEALKAKRMLKARWISFRYYWALLKAMGLSQVFVFVVQIRISALN